MVVVLSGPQVGERLELVDRAVVIGRSPEADLVLSDPDAWWRHCTLEPKDGAWVVRDLGGPRTTEVNGMRVAGELELAADDQILVGGTMLRLELHGPVELEFDRVVSERLTRDDLTGLSSRRRFDADAAALIEAARRDRTAVGVALFDIDGLKAINDRHGHLVGARVIAATGTILGGVVGSRGVACRYGGDEFALVCAGGAEALLPLAEEVVAAVRELRVPHEGELLGVEISGGVALYPDDGADLIALLRRADAALRRAKRAGGGRVSR